MLDVKPPTIASSEGIAGMFLLFLLFPREVSSWHLSILFTAVLATPLDRDGDPNSLHRFLWNTGREQRL